MAKAKLFRALGHPVRIRILELLVEGDQSVSNLAADTRLDASSLSQHLVIVVAVIVIGLPLYRVIDGANRSSDSFSDIDSNKTLLIVLTLVFPFLGAITYMATIRPKIPDAHR